MGTPVISIIIYESHDECTLKATLDSLLFQSFDEPYEVLVDLGTKEEKSRLLAASYALAHEEIAVIDDKSSSSRAERRIMASKQAQGEYLLFLENGDLLASNALKRGLKTMRDHPSCQMASFSFYSLKDNNHPLPALTHLLMEREANGKKGISRFFAHPSDRSLFLYIISREFFLKGPRINLKREDDVFEEESLIVSLLADSKSVFLSKDRLCFHKAGEPPKNEIGHARAQKRLDALGLMRLFLEKNHKEELVTTFRKKLHRYWFSFRRDLANDKKNGAKEDYIKTSKKGFCLLKKKSPLVEEGTYLEELAKRAL